MSLADRFHPHRDITDNPVHICCTVMLNRAHRSRNVLFASRSVPNPPAKQRISQTKKQTCSKADWTVIKVAQDLINRDVT